MTDTIDTPEENDPEKKILASIARYFLEHNPRAFRDAVLAAQIEAATTRAYELLCAAQGPDYPGDTCMVPVGNIFRSWEALHYIHQRADDVVRRTQAARSVLEQARKYGVHAEVTPARGGILNIYVAGRGCICLPWGDEEQLGRWMRETMEPKP